MNNLALDTRLDDHLQRTADLRGGAANSGDASPGALGSQPSIPDPEVPATAKRRRFTAKYKLSILEQAEASREEGAIGALLRREGLYSSHLTTWRRQREQGELNGLTPKKRGRKPTVNPLAEENQRLRTENARLARQLQQAETITAVQKKYPPCWGSRCRTPRPKRGTRDRHRVAGPNRRPSSGLPRTGDSTRVLLWRSG